MYGAEGKARLGFTERERTPITVDQGLAMLFWFFPPSDRVAQRANGRALLATTVQRAQMCVPAADGAVGLS